MGGGVEKGVCQTAIGDKDAEVTRSLTQEHLLQSLTAMGPLCAGSLGHPTLSWPLSRNKTGSYDSF